MQKKVYVNEKRYRIVKRGRRGIQGSNRQDKPWKRSKRTRYGRIISPVKRCLNCGTRRVQYHHKYCDTCWRMINAERYKINDITISKKAEESVLQSPFKISGELYH